MTDQQLPRLQKLKVHFMQVQLNQSKQTHQNCTQLTRIVGIYRNTKQIIAFK